MENINLIVAASSNNVIGVNNTLPWHLPNDLKRFKLLTKNSIVIMGRKTWESLPEKNRPLPNRLNYILTNDKNYIANGGIVFNSIEDVIVKLKESKTNAFVIGGGEIYKQFIPYTNKIYLTRVYKKIVGDAYLTGVDIKEWKLSDVSLMYNENGCMYRFEEYLRKN